MTTGSLQQCVQNTEDGTEDGSFTNVQISVEVKSLLFSRTSRGLSVFTTAFPIRVYACIQSLTGGLRRKKLKVVSFGSFKPFGDEHTGMHLV